MKLRPRTQRLLLLGLAVAAAAAAVAANWVLLGYAQSGDERVGKLSPKANLVMPIKPPVETDGGLPSHPGEADD